MAAPADKLPVETILTKGRRSASAVIGDMRLECQLYSALPPFGRRTRLLSSSWGGHSNRCRRQILCFPFTRPL